MDGYFKSGGYHINLNCFSVEDLEKAYENPELYPNLSIRVSGYAVRFAALTKEQQRDVISRTIHQSI